MGPRITIHSALNLEYEQWPRLLGNKELTEALLSRLRHQCQTIHINGPSLREPPRLIRGSHRGHTQSLPETADATSIPLRPITNPILSCVAEVGYFKRA